MSFIKRHGMAGMAMESGSLSMASASATSSMDMAMSSSTMDSGMDMSGMDHMEGMHMYFVGEWKNYPVLFKDLKASNGGQAFGIFLLLLVIGIFVRGLDFANRYLEQVVWKNPNYIDNCHPPKGVEPLPVSTGNCCDTAGNTTSGSIRKADSSSLEVERPVQVGAYGAPSQNSQLPIASIFFRNVIRLALCILPELLGYALMLAAMTFSVLYFFGVVLGLGIGRFIFDRLSDRMHLRPSSNVGFHC